MENFEDHMEQKEEQNGEQYVPAFLQFLEENAEEWVGIVGTKQPTKDVIKALNELYGKGGFYVHITSVFKHLDDLGKNTIIDLMLLSNRKLQHHCILFQHKLVREYERDFEQRYRSLIDSDLRQKISENAEIWLRAASKMPVVYAVSKLGQLYDKWRLFVPLNCRGLTTHFEAIGKGEIEHLISSRNLKIAAGGALGRWLRNFV